MKTMNDPAVEMFAEVWAGIDGKSRVFEKDKENHDLNNVVDWNYEPGYYLGYLADAQEFIRRLEERGFTVSKMT